MSIFAHLRLDSARLALALLSLTILSLQSRANIDDGKLESMKILRACGYTVRQYWFVSQNNAMLSLVRATNPLFNDGKHGLKNRQPILYLQGTTLGNALTLIDHHKMKPQDFSHLDAHKMSNKCLLGCLGHDEPSTRNFFLLALNFGHEVWYLNRRGFEGSFRRTQDQNRTMMDAIRMFPEAVLSMKRVGELSLTGGNAQARPRGDPLDKSKRQLEIPFKLPQFNVPFDGDTFLTAKMLQLMQNKQSPNFLDNLGSLFSPLNLLKSPEGALLLADPVFRQQFIDTMNPDFWNFSLDEQAEYDLPKAIDVVLEKTKQKRVHLVGLSTGGSIILLSHTVKPELKHKVGASILWAPAVNMGSSSDIVYQMSHLSPVLQSVAGPFPPIFLNKAIQQASQIFCTSDPKASRLCRLVFDSIFGYTGKQAVMGPIWWGNTFVSSPSGELRHLGQFAHTNETCKYNYNTIRKNMEVYGQPDPPCYNFSNIETRDLFFYISEDDRLVSMADMEYTTKQLSVDYKLRYIKEKGVHFNHLGYIIHEQNARLAVIPTLKDIASVEARYREEEQGQEEAAAAAATAALRRKNKPKQEELAHEARENLDVGIPKKVSATAAERPDPSPKPKKARPARRRGKKKKKMKEMKRRRVGTKRPPRDSMEGPVYAATRLSNYRQSDS